MIRRAALCLALCLTAQEAVALSASPFPRLRQSIVTPGVVAGLPRLLPVFGPAANTPRPHLRPTATSAGVQAIPVAAISAAGTRARSPRPHLRPAHTTATSYASSTTQPVATSGKGAICGDKGIRGETLSPIRGTLKGCGVSKPVRVSQVDGVALTHPATMDCATAKALKTWVNKGVKPSVGRLGGGVKSLDVIASYSCRTRNNQPGAKISEHGKGKAVDIAGFNLQNGARLDVLKGWNDPVQAKLLHRLHDNACGPFGTVLGPESDSFHKNHFHLDTASYRSGPYCR